MNDRVERKNLRTKQWRGLTSRQTMSLQRGPPYPDAQRHDPGALSQEPFAHPSRHTATRHCTPFHPLHAASPTIVTSHHITNWYHVIARSTCLQINEMWMICTVIPVAFTGVVCHAFSVDARGWGAHRTARFLHSMAMKS